MNPLQISPKMPLYDKRTLITLQWVVVIGTSYLSLFSEGRLVEDPWAYFLALVLLASILVLENLPRSAFDHRLLAQTVVVVDTILISVGIGLNRESPWDLFLIFFFGLFIASIGESLIQIVVGCLILSILSILLRPFSGMNALQIDPDLLLRVPFIFGIFLLFGYLTEQVKREKKRADELKSEFLNVITHEIKTPLSVVLGYTGLMRDGILGEINQKQEKALEKIMGSSKEILAMINSILEAATIEAGTVKVESHQFSLIKFLDELKSNYNLPLDKEVTITWDYPPDLPTMKTDRWKLKSILQNLINNAVKFTDEGHVTMSARFYSATNTLEFKVADTGMGIPKETLPLIFEKFRQMDGSQTRSSGGAGLGLYIVKSLTETLGGKVDVESEPNKGSIFTVTISQEGVASKLDATISSSGPSPFTSSRERIRNLILAHRS